jgi:hypothetical protein
LVLLLDWRSSDPIEVKALEFDFKGPAAPIVLSVLCFLAIVAGWNYVAVKIEAYMIVGCL